MGLGMLDSGSPTVEFGVGEHLVLIAPKILKYKVEHRQSVLEVYLCILALVLIR